VASGLDLPTAEDDYPLTHRLTEAAKALVDQHHAFTEAQLCKYVAKMYPETPTEVRRGLVIGAVAGAQRASHLRYIIVDNKKSPDEDKRKMAAHAANSLSFWGLGFRQEQRSDAPIAGPVRVSRAIGTSPSRDVEPSDKVCQSVDTQTSPKHTLEDLNFPVLPQKTNAEFDLLAEAARIACMPYASLFPEHPFEPGPLPIVQNQLTLDVEDENANLAPSVGSESADRTPIISSTAGSTASMSSERADLMVHSPLPPNGDSAPASESGLAIDVDAPSDVDEIVDVPAVGSVVRKAKSEECVVPSTAKKITSVDRPSTFSRTSSKPTASRTSPRKNRQTEEAMELRSPLARLERTKEVGKSQHERRRSPRLYSRSPRREDRRRSESPERVVLSGRELQEYRRLLNSDRRRGLHKL
jgi:hypothetical protein